MLSTEQRVRFEECGLLHLPGLVEARAVATLRERITELLRARGLPPEPCPPGFSVSPSKTASLVNAHAFEAVWGEPTLALLDELLGSGVWQRPRYAGQLLMVTFPMRGTAWQVPHKVWHLDYQAPGALRALPGVQLFLCVDRVAPRAGGTLVACGTHRLIDALRRREGTSFAGRSADVRRRLRAEVPWLRALESLREGEDRSARFLAPSWHEDVPLRVAELVGEPGDVHVMHPWLLHAPAANCGDAPRLVLTERIRVAECPT